MARFATIHTLSRILSLYSLILLLLPVTVKAWWLPRPPWAKDDGHWIDTWASMPQLTELHNLPPAPFNQTGVVFSNASIRQTVHISLGSPTIRLRISNAFGTTDLPITAVTVALPINGTAGGHAIDTKTLKTVTFSGDSSFTIPNGAHIVSDNIDLQVKADSILTVTIYLASGQRSNNITSHPGSRTTSWFAFGDHTKAASFTDSSTASVAHWYFLSAIEAWVPQNQGTLTIIGDSITDGRGSETDKNNRWPDLLFKRLQASRTTANIAYANQAAGGNRVLADGLGPNALGRIDRDLLAHPGVQYALIYEGVNDLGTAPATTDAQNAVAVRVIAAYKQMITSIHAHGIPVFGATITPFSAPSNVTTQPYSHPTREVARQTINKWIRTSGWFDAVADFDKILADPKIPSQLKPEFDTGDYLHPNVKGFQAIADNFPVDVFVKFAGGV